jgi:nucleotidyltransferase substrate binding protein (TIGR01987 family)
MTQLNTTYYARCVVTLDKAFAALNLQAPDSVEYDIYRAACVKEFEIILEQSGKLLKKCLKPYLASSKEADKLMFKDIFRVAAKHSLIGLDEAERWMKYRDNRNDTAHDYGEDFANETLALMPAFLIDAARLQAVINQNP